MQTATKWGRSSWVVAALTTLVVSLTGIIPWQFVPQKTEIAFVNGDFEDGGTSGWPNSPGPNADFGDDGITSFDSRDDNDTSPRADSRDFPLDKVNSQKLESLFDSFRNGKYTGRNFPKLNHMDIPGLLKLGKNKRILKAFPRSPISSQYESTCTEGMVALWLVEGIRKGKRYPSLNVLCFSKGQQGRNWTAKSEENHDQVFDAYQKWWKDSGSISSAEALKVNPLSERNLHWH